MGWQQFITWLMLMIIFKTWANVYGIDWKRLIHHASKHNMFCCDYCLSKLYGYTLGFLNHSNQNIKWWKPRLQTIKALWEIRNTPFYTACLSLKLWVGDLANDDGWYLGMQKASVTGNWRNAVMYRKPLQETWSYIFVNLYIISFFNL